jgi:hypothetical protein
VLSFPEYLIEKAQSAEAAQIADLRAQHAKLKEKHPDGVPMDLGDGEIHHVTSFAKVPGAPKADVIAHTKQKGVKKYISLKKSDDPKRHRQYGGVSHAKDNPLVQNFAKHLSKMQHTPDSPKHSVRLDRDNPHHEKLLHQAVFGKDYGGERGVNNVDVIHKGQLRIVPHPKHRGAYRLESDTSHYNGSLPKDVGGELVRENSKTQNDLGINNSRVTVNPTGHNKIQDITNKIK